MPRPSFTVTIEADDGGELDCRVWAEPAEPSVGILSPQFEIEADEPRRELTNTEWRRALRAAQEWKP